MVYQSLPIWHKTTIPMAFFERHNTKADTWAQLTILKGNLRFSLLNEQGQLIETHHFSVDNQPTRIAPQQWHKIDAVSDDIECQLQFLTEPRHYYVKKYQLSLTHPDVINAAKRLMTGNALDLGSGRGRNSLYLAQQGFDVTALDFNQGSIELLNQIILEEKITNLKTAVYNIETANLTHCYDLIISTVVFMFLNKDRIPDIIHNMQAATTTHGFNLIVCAMSTDDYPCPVPFSFTFKKNELLNYYKEWDIIEYNEDIGSLQRKDENGNRIKCRFATLLAKKL